MPELPEAEVVRRGLERWAAGRIIGRVEVLDARSLRRNDGGASAFAAQLEGAQIESAVRRGKFLWLALRERDEALVLHLGMSGQALIQTAELPDPKHLKVRLELSSDRAGDDAGPVQELRFTDQRIFGGMWLSPLIPTGDGAPGGLGSERPILPLAARHIARDALDPLWTAAGFYRAITRLPNGRERGTAIKRVLLDQAVISGIGNIYADEALWEARVHYEQPAATLSRAKGHALFGALTRVMRRALAEGGTSFDALYVNVEGQSGYFARSLQAYGRIGQPCTRCGALLVREPFMGRSSFFCPRCQRNPGLTRPPR